MDLNKAYVNGALRLEQLYVELFNVIPNSYLYYEEGLFFKTSDLTLEKCKEFFGENIELKVHEENKIYSTSKADDRKIEEWDDISQSFRSRTQPYVMVLDRGNKRIISIDESSIKIYSTTYDSRDFVNSILKDIPKQEKVNKTATIDLVAYDHNYYTINSKIKHTSIDFDTNYNDGFVDIYKKTIDFLNEQESGLIIWHGEKGTGKTSAIRHLLSHTDKKYILVTNAIAAHMAEPEFIAFMMENKDSIFILEDCEQILMAREENRFGGAIANILNMSDGLMSDIFNIKFICTFNTEIKNIDEALLRPGRCFVNYEFKALSKEKSSELLKSLGHDVSAPREMTLAEIYNYNPEMIVSPKKKVGF